MKHNFFWMQLQTHDMKKAKDFYAKLFRWDFREEKNAEQEYTEINAGDGPCAGIGQQDEKGPSMWIPFVNVEDIHTHTKKAKELGGEVVVNAHPLKGGEEGYYSVILDPTQAVIGLYEPPEKRK